MTSDVTSSYSYGQLEGCLRWAAKLYQTNDQVAGGCTWEAPPGHKGLLSMRQLQEFKLSRFPPYVGDFLALPRLVQIRIIEMLSYKDLKCVERVKVRRVASRGSY